jgi:hypothetical protein
MLLGNRLCYCENDMKRTNELCGQNVDFSL